MKAILVVFDSLNRRFLPPYGASDVHAPNFARLAARAVTCDNAWAGSLPTMPTRRDLHTGRHSFLHTSWGPIEPYDESVMDLLAKQGVYTHLASDSYHYYEDGGATYHGRYTSWEFFRGQESDPWVGQVREPETPVHLGQVRRQHLVGRQHMRTEADWSCAQTAAAGATFIRRNHADDNWLLHVEFFDPHEPFWAPRKYRDLYPDDYGGPLFDWPRYGQVTEPPEAVRHLRHLYRATVSMCDAALGDVLDAMDAHDLWRDTMLIVTTDHGHFVGERGLWGKNVMPWYNELSHLPWFVWDPRAPRPGARCPALMQWIDIAPTLLDYFGTPIPDTVRGRSLRPCLADDAPGRESALFGSFGAMVNITDGRYVYLRAAAPGDQPLYRYTLMPTNLRGFAHSAQLAQATLAPPTGFSRGAPLLRIPVPPRTTPPPLQDQSLLFDLARDPGQTTPLADPALEARMVGLLRAAMAAHEAPPEQYHRLGLDPA